MGPTGATGPTGSLSGTITGNLGVTGTLTAGELVAGSHSDISSQAEPTFCAGTATATDMLNADAFHTNGQNCGQMLMSGSYVNSNATLFLNADNPPFDAVALEGAPSTAPDVQIGHTLFVGGHLAVQYGSEQSSEQSTVGGVWLGVSPQATNGAFSYGSYRGYRAAKAICEAYAASLPAPTSSYAKYAHMCSAEEISRSLQVGISLGGSGGIYPSVNAWYSTFARPHDSSTVIDDCDQWTNPNGSEIGPFVQNGDRLINIGSCNSNFNVACCL